MEIYKRKSESFFRFNTDSDRVNCDVDYCFYFTSKEDISSEAINNTQEGKIDGFCRFSKLCQLIEI